MHAADRDLAKGVRLPQAVTRSDVIADPLGYPAP